MNSSLNRTTMHTNYPQITHSFITVLIAVLIGFSSCEKSDNPAPDNIISMDTIKPLEYFPAFPGSFWVYNNNDTLKVAGYEKFKFSSSDYASVPTYDSLILPKLILNGIYNPGDSVAYVKEYSISKSSNSNYRDPAFYGLLSTIKGAEFTIGASIQGHKITGKTIKDDTTIVIGSITYQNVIVTIIFDYAWINQTGNPPETCAFVKEYYAKNVGLIRREKRNYPVSSEFVKDIELRYYKIKR